MVIYYHLDYHHTSKYSTNCVPFTMRSPLSVNTYTLHQACVPNTQAVSNMHNVYVSGVKINVHCKGVQSNVQWYTVQWNYNQTHSELVIRIINYKLIVLYAVAKTFKEHECFVIV